MITEAGKVFIRLHLESNLYNAILSPKAIEHYGLEGVYLMLQDAPSVLDEIIQRNINTVKRCIDLKYNDSL